MGSGALACPLLEAVRRAGQDDVAAVVTAPDRAAGRGLKATSCALKPLAEAAGLRVLNPPDASAAAFVEELRALEPDVVIVACYGQMLRANVLAVPALGTINVHPSLLPKYRGASPIQWALANGDTVTGVSVLHVTPKMDAGDVLAQEPAPILPHDTMETLEPRLAKLGGELLIRVLDRFRAGHVDGVPQDEAAVTFARKLTKEDGRVRWELTAQEIHNRVRGFAPWPGAFTTLPDGTRLKLLATRAEPMPGGAAPAAPGKLLEAGGDGLLVAAGRGALRLVRVQPAGRKGMEGAAFARGARLQAGDQLGKNG